MARLDAIPRDSESRTKSIRIAVTLGVVDRADILIGVFSRRHRRRHRRRRRTIAILPQQRRRTRVN